MTAISVLLGLGVGLSSRLLLLVGVTVLVGQLSIGWSNDWLDAARDSASGRTDKPTTTGDVGVNQLRAAALTALVVSIPLSLLAGVTAGTCQLLLVASGWAYNLGLKRVVLSPLPYAVGFGALPAYVTQAGAMGVQAWMVLAGGLLGVAAHFANAAPDVVGDLSVGVRGAPQRLGTRASLLVALALLAAGGVAAVMQQESDAMAGWLAVLVPPAVGAALVVRGQVKPVFPLVMCAALIDVAVIVVAA
ncbi:MAG: UbiA family prenyltransferase [Actinomycetes bacterium]